MIDKHERLQIISLIQREVVPAIGCTEPTAVALCVAKATDMLGEIPVKITTRLSTNILKNAMGVGIPGTGMTGLPVAIALGAILGKPENQLEVLKGTTPETVERAKKYINEKRIHIELKENICEKLYIEAVCEGLTGTATAIIAGGHTSFVYLEHNGKVLLDHSEKCPETEETVAQPELSLHKVYDFATTTPLEEIEFILETARTIKRLPNVLSKEITATRSVECFNATKKSE